MTVETSNAREWVLVPREPTMEMRIAAYNNSYATRDIESTWAAMLAAALSQQPEARGAVDEAMVERAREAYFNAAEVNDGVFTDPVAMRAALTAALTGERNG